MVTIRHLEVRLEKEGEGDEAIFAQYFEKYIGQWNRKMEEAKVRQRLADTHRSVGAHDSGEAA
jgi:hypothetical protein